MWRHTAARDIPCSRIWYLELARTLCVRCVVVDKEPTNNQHLYNVKHNLEKCKFCQKKRKSENSKVNDICLYMKLP